MKQSCTGGTAQKCTGFVLQANKYKSDGRALPTLRKSCTGKFLACQIGLACTNQMSAPKASFCGLARKSQMSTPYPRYEKAVRCTGKVSACQIPRCISSRSTVKHSIDSLRNQYRNSFKLPVLYPSLLIIFSFSYYM
jgi:hypothetical protein